MQCRGSSRRSDLLVLPQEVFMPRKRSKSMIGKFSTTVVDFLSGNNDEPFIGKTPREVITELAADLKSGYLGQDQDKYTLVRELAVSSEGRILLMESRATGQLCVVKHLFPISVIPGDLPNEAVILAHTLYPHPNIISIFETYPDCAEAGRYRIWMEYCSGGSLFDQIDFWYTRRRSIVPEVFLLHIIVELMEALAFLHGGLRYTGANGKYTQDDNHKAVIHGDIKDENIFLRWPLSPIGGLPTVVLGDFGIAKLAGDKKARLMPGTLVFHSPELKALYGDTSFCRENTEQFFEVGKQRTRAADIYAVGQIIAMIAEKERGPGKIGRDPASVQVSRDYEAPGIREFLVRCLAVDPAKRAQASFNEKNGIMPLVEELRKARDRWIRSRQPLHRTEWINPWPVSSRG